MGDDDILFRLSLGSNLKTFYVLSRAFPWFGIFLRHAPKILSGKKSLLDNIKVGHARLNIDARRDLHGFMSEYIDQEMIYP